MCSCGVRNNTIVNNNITANVVGIRISNSNYNIIYHNLFDNTNQAQVTTGSTNTWNDNYPSGGNTWNGYSDVDVYSGPYQNETGSDDIWDHPYVIDANNIDNYPIVTEFPSSVILLLLMSLSTIAVVFAKKKAFKKTDN